MPKPWRTISPTCPARGGRRAGVRACLARGEPSGGRRDPARRGLVQGEPLRLRPRCCARTGWRRCASTSAGTARARGALGAGAIDDVATIRTAAAGRRAGGPAGVVDGRLDGDRVAAAGVGAAAVVAICPATTDGLCAGLRERRASTSAPTAPRSRRCSPERPRRGRARLAERLLLLHAEGDETVPVEHSRDLPTRPAPGSRLVVPRTATTARSSTTPSSRPSPAGSREALTGAG